MSIIRATLDSLAGMLSVRGDQIEDALASERLVRAGMSRRGFFRGTSAAVAALALPSGIGMADAPRVVLAAKLSLAAKTIVMTFDGLFALDWAPSYNHSQAAAPAPATIAPPSIQGHAASPSFR
ncbi:MAG TPA: hypothetical protein VK571_10135 [Gemmatimonadaceae bacterium]|nr:hypothetical protein [Gemmatimonadaceae bacterium]